MLVVFCNGQLPIDRIMSAASLYNQAQTIQFLLLPVQTDIFASLIFEEMRLVKIIR